MGEVKRKVFDKENPGADGRKFIPLSSNAMHYIHHDKMDASKLLLYALIVDYFNVNEGVAWPSLERLAVDYGKTSKTTGNHLKDLREAGLILTVGRGRYVPLEPLSAEEFYKEHPKAWENYTKARETSEKRRKADLVRLRDYEERKRHTRN